MKMQGLLFKKEKEKLFTLFCDLCLYLLWGFYLLVHVLCPQAGGTCRGPQPLVDAHSSARPPGPSPCPGPHQEQRAAAGFGQGKGWGSQEPILGGEKVTGAGLHLQSTHSKIKFIENFKMALADL